MLLKFKQACRLGKQHFKVGVHEVDEEAQNDSYFARLVKGGLIVEADSKQAAPLADSLERNKMLYDKLVTKKTGKPVFVPETQKTEKSEAPKEEAKPAAEEKPVEKKKKG